MGVGIISRKQRNNNTNMYIFRGPTIKREEPNKVYFFYQEGGGGIMNYNMNSRFAKKKLSQIYVYKKQNE